MMKRRLWHIFRFASSSRFSLLFPPELLAGGTLYSVIHVPGDLDGPKQSLLLN